jgi:KDO2-lipid IV(A) lauroyltransferase
LNATDSTDRGRWRDRLAYALIRGLVRLPFGACGRAGGLLGRVAYRLGRREVETARTNLALCFPEWSGEARERVVRRNLVETGRSLAQMMRLFAGAPLDLDPLVDENGFIEACRERVAAGRGLIIALPHLGNWELIAYRITRAGPTTALYRPPRMAALDGLIREGRMRSGISVVPIDRQGLKRLHTALRDGEIIGILPDQVPKAAGAAGVVAPFFDHPALTMTLVNRLARRHDTPVVFCCAVPEPGSDRHRFHYFDGEAALADTDPEVAAAALNRGVERCVRAFPAYYQWTYRRFDIPGSGHSSPYKSRR